MVAWTNRSCLRWFHPSVLVRSTNWPCVPTMILYIRACMKFLIHGQSACAYQDSIHQCLLVVWTNCTCLLWFHLSVLVRSMDNSCVITMISYVKTCMIHGLMMDKPHGLTMIPSASACWLHESEWPWPDLGHRRFLPPSNSVFFLNLSL